MSNAIMGKKKSTYYKPSLKGNEDGELLHWRISNALKYTFKRSTRMMTFRTRSSPNCLAAIGSQTHTKCFYRFAS